jgi:hypothetical protein
MGNQRKSIKNHKKLPNHTNKDKNTRYLAGWISLQKENFKINKQIMTNKNIRKIWEEFVNKYKEVFKTTKDIWKYNFNRLIEYINIHNILPTSSNEDENIKYLGLWVRNQTKCYDKKQFIMKNEEIRTLWEDFLNMKGIKLLFLNNEEMWNYNKTKVEEYIQEHNKLPAQTDKIQDIAVLGNWIQSQKQNYKNKTKIMINENIRKLWEDFVKQYKIYFMSNEEIWMQQLEKVKKYIDENDKRPSSTDKNKDIKRLGKWINTQNNNYIKKYQIMKNQEIYDKWKEFINDEKYKVYFKIV